MEDSPALELASVISSYILYSTKAENVLEIISVKYEFLSHPRVTLMRYYERNIKHVLIFVILTDKLTDNLLCSLIASKNYGNYSNKSVPFLLLS